MPVRNLEQTIELKVIKAKEKLLENYCKQFLSTTTSEERELLHVKTKVLKDVIATLINTLHEMK